MIDPHCVLVPVPVSLAFHYTFTVQRLLTSASNNSLDYRTY
jgi:hypothetical protein